MRENGVPNFPDPDSQGHIVITSESGFDPNSSEYKAAQKACANLRPAGNGGAGGSGGSEQMLKLAECMRHNGVPSFPDPQNGAVMLDKNSGIDPSSPAFQKAQKACQSLMPGGTSSGGSQ